MIVGGVPRGDAITEGLADERDRQVLDELSLALTYASFASEHDSDVDAHFGDSDNIGKLTAARIGRPREGANSGIFTKADRLFDSFAAPGMAGDVLRVRRRTPESLWGPRQFD